MRSDTELIAAVLQGETEAFGSVVLRYKSAVYGLALSFLKDFDAAYDVSQEVFLRAFLNLGQLKDPEQLPAWLRSITANTCKMWLRQQPDSVPIEHLDRESVMPIGNPRPETPDEAWEREESRRAVLHALSKLSEGNRQALSLYYIDGLSTPEIASFLGASPEVIRQRIRRARMQLKKEVLKMIGETLQKEAPGDEFKEELDRLLDQTRNLFLRADYQAAVPALERAAQMAPDDTLVSMLLSDAYTWGRTAKDIEADPKPYHRARTILKALVEREPDNLLARIKLAHLEAVMEKTEDVLEAHEKNLQLARDGPFEPWALLNLSRVYAARRRHEEAMTHYRNLIELEPRLSGVAYTEAATSCCLKGDIREAIASLKKAIKCHEDQSQETLAEYTRRLMGEAYWKFWENADERLVKLCQAHVYLAGLYAKNQEPVPAKEHLGRALDYLNQKELASIRHQLVKEFLHLVETLFPELAGEAAVQRLKEEASQVS